MPSVGRPIVVAQASRLCVSELRLSRLPETHRRDPCSTNMKPALPYEVSEFENLLRKPNSDPTGFAGFFNSGEVWVTRVPARLDVMGGIADYSGANVCEAVLGQGILMALQPRNDRTLRI